MRSVADALTPEAFVRLLILISVRLYNNHPLAVDLSTKVELLIERHLKPFHSGQKDQFKTLVYDVEVRAVFRKHHAELDSIFKVYASLDQGDGNLNTINISEFRIFLKHCDLNRKMDDSHIDNIFESIQKSSTDPGLFLMNEFPDEWSVVPEATTTPRALNSIAEIENDDSDSSKSSKSSTVNDESYGGDVDTPCNKNNNKKKKLSIVVDSPSASSSFSNISPLHSDVKKQQARENTSPENEVVSPMATNIFNDVFVHFGGVVEKEKPTPIELPSPTNSTPRKGSGSARKDSTPISRPSTSSLLFDDSPENLSSPTSSASKRRGSKKFTIEMQYRKVKTAEQLAKIKRGYSNDEMGPRRKRSSHLVLNEGTNIKNKTTNEINRILKI